MDRPAFAALLETDRRTPEDVEATRRTVAGGAVLSGSYLAMNAAATLIAGFGLLADSVAVVIGAMLIAMLYGPILGIALALAEADLRLLRRSLIAEIVGAVWVLAIGFVIGLAARDVPIGEQILARTAPNILDLMIALVGGLAGAYATVSPRVSGAVVGVAIATALCPPLTACGILLAHGLPGLAEGAFLLFLTNFAAIATGALVVFLVAGHRGVFHPTGLQVTWAARLLPVALAILLSFHLVGVFRNAVADLALRSRINEAIDAALVDAPGARLIELRLGRERTQRTAYAVIRAPQPFTSEAAARLDDAVDRAAGRDVSLHVRVVRVEEFTRDGRLYDPTAASERRPR